jgi:hypothetical protein
MPPNHQHSTTLNHSLWKRSARAHILTCLGAISGPTAVQTGLHSNWRVGWFNSVAHMRAPPPLGQAEDNDFHPGWMAGPPSAGWGRRSGPSAPARKGRVCLHQPHPILEIKRFLNIDRFIINFLKKNIFFFAEAEAGPPSQARQPPFGGLTAAPPPACQPRGPPVPQPSGGWGGPCPCAGD